MISKYIYIFTSWSVFSLDIFTTVQVSEESYRVIYKRPTDLKVKEDVEVCCNLLITNIFDKGLLSSGIIPAIQHALSELMIQDSIIMPSSATVYAQAVELRTTDVAGLDMSAANLYRWCLNQVPDGKLSTDVSETGAVKTLSEPASVWYFDFSNPPTRNDTKMIDLSFTQDGRMNAIMFWYEIHLFGDVYISSGLDAAKEPGNRYLQPGIQYLAGELRVDKGTTMPIVATHNTVRMQFDIESADYLHLMKRDASFPHHQFELLADTRRIESYGRAIHRAVQETIQEEGEAHVLDIGTGAGPLAILAAKAGASSVVACDIHDSLCDIARKATAANNVYKNVSVIHKDCALLQRGREVRPLGVNIVVADMFDCGLLGDQFSYILDITKRRIVQPQAKVIPQAASIYCVGVEALSKPVEGVKVSSFDKYRWNSTYEAIDGEAFNYKVITKPVKVTEVSFSSNSDGNSKQKVRDSLLKLRATQPGMLNAVLFWFDLHLDDMETISNGA